MQKLSFICLILLLCVNVHSRAQNAPPAATATAPRITFVASDTMYDFGGVPMGMSIPYEFEIKNTGNAPLVISAMSCELANVQLKWPAKPIKPGKKGSLLITYNAKTEIGSFDNSVSVTSNATVTPLLIHITGAIIPAESPYSAPAKKDNKITVEATASPFPPMAH